MPLFKKTVPNNYYYVEMVLYQIGVVTLPLLFLIRSLMKD